MAQLIKLSLLTLKESGSNPVISIMVDSFIVGCIFTSQFVLHGKDCFFVG